MSRTDPPQVVADPAREHLISTFTIPLVIDNGTTTRAVSAAGELRWLPDVAWWPPVLTLTIVFLAIVTGIVVLVVAANMIRTIADLSSPQLTTSLPDWLARWTVAANYTVVAPALLAAALAGHWYARSQHDDPDTSSDVTARSP